VGKPARCARLWTRGASACWVGARLLLLLLLHFLVVVGVRFAFDWQLLLNLVFTARQPLRLCSSAEEILCGRSAAFFFQVLGIADL
jgi:hypothetical protein